MNKRVNITLEVKISINIQKKKKGTHFILCNAKIVKKKKIVYE